MQPIPTSPWRRLVLYLMAVVGLGAGAGTSRAQESILVFEADVPIAMRDGTKLTANIWRPRDEARHPVILQRSPYGKPGETDKNSLRYVAAGYVMVVQDCRGRGKSGGEWDPFRYDVEDGHDTQEWVGHQSWCNGSIGTAGGSYLGWTQWASAANASPYLKCMVPMVPFNEVYHDIAYPGGALQLSLLMGWGTGVGGVTLTPDQMQSAFRHLPLSDFGDQFEKKVPYLNDWVRHSTHDEYWKKREMGGRFSDVTIPVLNIGGWYDIFSKTTLDEITRVRASSRDRHMRRNQFAVIGPWAHGVGVTKVGALDFGPQAKLDLGDLQLRWFNYWLRDQGDDVQDWPAFRIFVMGENRWRGEHEWPLERTRFTPYFLRSQGKANSDQGDGALSPDKTTENPPDTFVNDPNDPVPTRGGNNLVGAPAGPYDQSEVEKRQDVLIYTTEALTTDTEVTGPVKMVLWAASSAPDTDFTAKLVDVHPDGKSYNLCDGIIRAKSREGTAESKPLTPGQTEKYEIDLWVTSNVFRQGHRIRVEVASSNFPRFDRNPNSGKPFGTDTVLLKATQTIYHDAAHPSHLLLPLIPR